MALRRTPVALGVLAAVVLTGGAAYAMTTTAHSTRLAAPKASTVSDVSTGSTRTVYLEADLDGHNEQLAAGGSATGAPHATAMEVLRIRGNQVAYALSWQGLGMPTVAHVRQGAAGQAGAAVITQLTSPLPPTVTAVAGTLTVHGRVLSQLVGNPGMFYLNLGTSTYPAGAVRGQFHKVGPVDLDRILHAGPLAGVGSGAQEVPLSGTGTGDPDATATAFVGLGRTSIGFALTWAGIHSPTSASINKGAVGANGTAVAALFTAEHGLAASVTAVAGMVNGVSAKSITAVRANPAGFHFNVFTAAFPGGAARGQLFETTATAPTTMPTMPTTTTTAPPVTTTQPTTTMPVQPTTTHTMPSMPTSDTTVQPTINTPAPPHW
jgi:CHRD domain